MKREKVTIYYNKTLFISTMVWCAILISAYSAMLFAAQTVFGNF